MKKILILNGSPKGEASNTLKFTNAFAKGIQEKDPDTEIEIIHVVKKNIEHCRGCFSCWGPTASKCVIQDDMPEILDKIVEADYLLMAFPLYYFGMPSLAKAVLDRSIPIVYGYDGGYTLHEPRYEKLSTKKYALISSCGYTETQSMYGALLQEFEMIFGHVGYAKLLVPQAEAFKFDSFKGLSNKVYAALEKAGNEIVCDGKVSEETEKLVSTPFLPQRLYEKLLGPYWNSFDQPGMKAQKKEQ